MDVIWWKVIAFFSFFVVGGGFALVPLLINKVESNSRKLVITFAECFAGGIFLGTGWVHLLPEAAHELETLGSAVPIANMLSVCGFMLVFLLEKVFFMRNMDEYNFDDEEAPRKPLHNHGKSSPQTPRSNLTESKSLDNGTIELLPVDSDDPKEEIISLTDNNSASPTPHLRRQTHDQHSGHDHGTTKLLVEDSEQVGFAKKLLPYVLMIVLSIHSVIAGVTMGVAPSAEAMVPLFVAIISHKWTESFALGVNLLKLNDVKKIVKCTIIYTGMVPLGLILGSILSIVLSGESAVLTTAILNGIASGTFIYIAIVDILLEQFNDAHYKFYKYMFTFFGFFVITGLFLMFDEE